MIEVKLTTPVQHGDETLFALELREMTGADMAKCGYPMQISDEGETFTPNAAVCAKLISRLGRVPPHVVDKLSAADFQSAMMEIIAFLGKAPSAQV